MGWGEPQGTRPITRQRSPWEQQALPPVAAAALQAQGMQDITLHVRRVGDGVLRALRSHDPGLGLHLSVSFAPAGAGRRTRYPTWDELAHARYELLPHDLDFVMHLPPPSEYVAVHDTTFHLHQHPAVD